MRRPIYLDHHATTPVDPRVLEAMRPYFEEEFGNASSATHVYGWRAEAAVEDARERLASAIGAARASEIVFTSGTTESDNLALLGVARAARSRRDHLVTTQIEHPAVLDAAAAFEADGGRVTRLAVDAQGHVDPAELDAVLDDRTALVSVMAANSEIGVLQPLEELARVCHAHAVPLHTDAAQWVGKLPLDVRALGVDLLSMCAHKLYGPKGVGALYVREGRPRIKIAPIVHGGGHERGLRSGTLPVPLIVGFARAVELCIDQLAEESTRVARLRDRLWEALRKGVDDVHRHGDPEACLPGNLNVAFDGVPAAALLPSLPDLALSTGSACSSGSGRVSHVLTAIGVAPERAACAIRFGLGRDTTEAQIDQAAAQVVSAVREIRRQAG
jgi:cysteine desulfurase